MTKDQIRAIFLGAGFTIKQGQDDLRPYVYDAAYCLLSASIADTAGAIAWIRKTDITELTDSEPETDGWTPLYAAPPASSVADAAGEKSAHEIKWPDGYCRDPNGRICVPKGKDIDFNFGYDLGYYDAMSVKLDAIADFKKRTASESAAGNDKKLADLYVQMQRVAQANGFESLSEAIACASLNNLNQQGNKMNIDREIARKSLYYIEGNLPDGPTDQAEFERHKALLKMIATREKHSDDGWIDAFALAMKAKMDEARQKGRSGWEGAAPFDLSWMLRDHVDKGDPIDVANFCMMLWALQERIHG